MSQQLKSKVVLGDSTEKLKDIPDNSIDFTCSDPPYFMINKDGGGFMGKNWDSININDSFNILCKSKEIVYSVIRFILLMRIESNMEEENIVQKNVNIKEEKPIIPKLNVNVPFVEKNSLDPKVKLKANINSVQGIVLTKAEIQDMLKELLPNPINAIEKLPENALFAIPIFYIQGILTKNIVLKNVLKSPIKKICEGKKIQLGLMDAQRIVYVIEGMIGKQSENKSINEIFGHAKYVKNIVKNMKFKHIILLNINLRKIIQWLTLLLFVINVMPKSKMELSHALVQQFHVNWLKECYRVMKSGSFMFAMGSSRTDCMLDIMNAFTKVGFETNFSNLAWVYASGFNKSANMAKLIDKRFLNDWLKGNYNISITKIEKIYKKIIDKAKKEKDEEKANKFERKYDSWLNAVKTKWARIIYDKELIKKSYEHPMRKNRSYQTKSNIFSGDRKNDKIKKKSPFPMDHKSESIEITRGKILDDNLLTIIKPISPEAIKFDGSYSGSQPKPAYELIYVIMKPLTKKSYSYIDQALDNGKGITWLDNCRIPRKEFEEAKTKEEKIKLKKKLVGGRYKQSRRWTFGEKEVDGYKNQELDDIDINPKGGVPANLLISDKILDQGIKKKSKKITQKLPTKGSFAGSEGNYIPDNSNKHTSRGYDDEGDFSRYFSLDLWWEDHIKKLPKVIQKTFPFLYCPKASKPEKNKGLTQYRKKVNDGRKTKIDNPFQRGETERKNTHPTVKPIKLMSYLITLGSRKGDIILDPFAGSGTTGIACKLEDRRFILIEKEKESYEIMKNRLKAYHIQRKLM